MRTELEVCTQRLLECIKFLITEKLVEKPENYLKVFFNEYSLSDVFRLFFEATVTAMGDRDCAVFELNAWDKTSFKCLSLSFITLN